MWGSGPKVSADRGGFAAARDITFQSIPDTPTNLHLPFRDLTENPNPISLLSWHTTLSRFVGRDYEIRDLLDWAGTKSRLSAKLITAEGGAGNPGWLQNSRL